MSFIMLKLCQDSLGFKLNKKFVKVIVLKFIFIDLTALFIKIFYEIYKHGANIKMNMIFKIIVGALYLNFLNLNNIQLIIVRSLFHCINRRLQEIFKEKYSNSIKNEEIK